MTAGVFRDFPFGRVVEKRRFWEGGGCCFLGRFFLFLGCIVVGDGVVSLAFVGDEELLLLLLMLLIMKEEEMNKKVIHLDCDQNSRV